MTSIEVVFGVTIAGLVLAFSSHAVVQFVNSTHEVAERTEALLLASEGIEMLTFLRDDDWTNIGNLPNETTRYLDVTSSAVSVTTDPEVIGDFSRSFFVDDVYRNATTDDIVASTTVGSVADTNSKYVTVSVTWNGSEHSVSLTTILTNIEL